MMKTYGKRRHVQIPPCFGNHHGFSPRLPKQSGSAAAPTTAYIGAQGQGQGQRHADLLSETSVGEAQGPRESQDSRMMGTLLTEGSNIEVSENPRKRRKIDFAAMDNDKENNAVDKDNMELDRAGDYTDGTALLPLKPNIVGPSFPSFCSLAPFL